MFGHACKAAEQLLRVHLQHQLTYPMNIKLYYIYKDFKNYKKHNELVFLNPNCKPLEEIKSTIHAHLIDGQYFYASEWKVPDLHFENWDTDEDHFLHEFGSVEETNQPTTNNISIEDFLVTVSGANNHF